jgi:hypothetical protein
MSAKSELQKVLGRAIKRARHLIMNQLGNTDEQTLEKRDRELIIIEYEVMRRRLLIVVTALCFAAGLGLQTRAGDTPEVRLLQGPDKVAGFYALREPRPPVSWGLTGLEPKPWTARFQIRVPPGSDIILSNGPINVEMRDANGNCVATGTLPTFPSSPLLPMPYIAGIRIVSVTPTLPVAPPTRSLRFSIGYRTVTLQERGRKEFNKCGFRHRLPRLANWITGWLPSTPHWLVHHTEVQLPSFQDDSETHKTYAHQPPPTVAQ